MAARFVRNGRFVLPAIGGDDLDLFISIYINKPKKCSRIYSKDGLSSFLYNFTVIDVVRTVEESVVAYYLTGNTKKPTEKWYKTPKYDGLVPIFALNQDSQNNDRSRNVLENPTKSKKQINGNVENSKTSITRIHNNDIAKDPLNNKHVEQSEVASLSVKDDGHNEKLIMRLMKSSRGSSHSDFMLYLRDNCGPKFIQDKRTNSKKYIFAKLLENDINRNKASNQNVKKANWADEYLQKVDMKGKCLDGSFTTFKDKKDGNRAGKSSKQSENGYNSTTSKPNDNEYNGKQFMEMNTCKPANLAIDAQGKTNTESTNNFPIYNRKDGNCGGKCSKYKTDTKVFEHIYHGFKNINATKGYEGGTNLAIDAQGKKNTESTNNFPKCNRKDGNCSGKCSKYKTDTNVFEHIYHGFKNINDIKGYEGSTNLGIDAQGKTSTESTKNFPKCNRKDGNCGGKCSKYKTDTNVFEHKYHGFKNIDNIKEHVPQKLPQKRTKRSIYEAMESASTKAKQTFTGFTTANSKKIHVSEPAIKKTRVMYEATDFKDIKAKQVVTGFTTANSKKIHVSEAAIKRARYLCEDSDSIGMETKQTLAETDNSHVFEPAIKKARTDNNNLIFDNATNPISVVDTDLSSLLDSQITKHFEELICEEKSNEIVLLSNSTVLEKRQLTVAANVKFTFDENYKKQTVVQLKNLKFTLNGHRDSFLFQYNYKDLLMITFKNRRNDITKNKLSVTTLLDIFKNSVDNKIIPDRWLENHARLILWKLISYEFQFGENMFVCNARELLHQLKYRYDRELCNIEIPALRKVYQRSEPSSRPMVLSVLKISRDLGSSIELILTDGWYCIRSVIDNLLAQMVAKNEIVVGTKLMIIGAELMKCNHGMEPWEEDANEVQLKIFGNSTRRVRWHTRLGFHGIKSMPVSLSSVHMDGGKISSLRVFVTRVYPILYMEKLEDKRFVSRRERAERLYQIEKKRDQQLHLEGVVKNVCKRSNQQLTKSRGSERYAFGTGSHIASTMKHSRNAAELQTDLTSTLKRMFVNYGDGDSEEMIKIAKNSMSGQPVCNVIPLQNIRISTCSVSRHVAGLLSIWNHQDYQVEEGSFITVTNVFPSRFRNSRIHLSTGHRSVITRHAVKHKVAQLLKPTERLCHSIRDLIYYSHVWSYYNEVDTVGLVFLIEPAKFNSAVNSTSTYEHVYLADDRKNIICIQISGGLKRFGFEDFVVVGETVAVLNLQKGRYLRNNMVNFLFTEFTEFTKHPGYANARRYIDELNNKFCEIDIEEFCRHCTVLKQSGRTAETAFESSYSDMSLPLSID